MKNKLLLIILLVSMVLIAGCTRNSRYENCLKKYPNIEYKKENYCLTSVCKDINPNLTYGGGSWAEPYVYCETTSRNRIKVDFSGNQLPECKELAEQRYNMDKCVWR